MKKIVFNGGTLADKETFGVQRNALELLKELDKIAKPGMYEIAIPEGAEKDLKFFNNIEVEKVGEPKVRHMKRFLWNHWVFPRYVRKNKSLGVDMILALPLWGCDAVFIYDCIAERFPENSKSLKEKISRLFYLIRVKVNLHRCKVVFTDSQNAKEDIINYHHYKAENIHVIYCGWQHFNEIVPDDSVLNEMGVEKNNYFFSLGSRYVHKNFKWVASAALQNPGYKFVVSGSSSLNSSDSNLEAEKIPNLIFTGYLSDEKVKSLMSNCKAFIQPSLCEGFGIPPMEAMSVGADCIVSQRSSLPEIYGNSVWYINPDDYDNIDLDAIMCKKKERNDVILEKYSWKESAKQYNHVLSSLEGVDK